MCFMLQMKLLYPFLTSSDYFYEPLITFGLDLGKDCTKEKVQSCTRPHKKDHVKMISKVLNTTGGSVVLFVARGNIFQINSIRKHSDKFPL